MTEHMKTITESGPYQVENGDQIDLRIREGDNEITVAKDIRAAFLMPVVKRASMFPLMLAAMTLSEQILWRVANERFATPEDVTGARDAHNALKAVMTIIRARGLVDRDEQSQALAEVEALQKKSLDSVLVACVKALQFMTRVEAAEWQDGGPETMPDVEEFRQVLAGFGLPEKIDEEVTSKCNDGDSPC